jgi:hypothetical protein
MTTTHAYGSIRCHFWSLCLARTLTGSPFTSSRQRGEGAGYDRRADQGRFGSSQGARREAGRAKLAKARRSAVASIKALADQHASNVLLVIREIRRAGATSPHQIADALNARGITTPWWSVICVVGAECAPGELSPVSDAPSRPCSTFPWPPVGS